MGVNRFLKVLVVYPFFPHYRLPIMREMVRQETECGIQYLFLGGRPPSSSGIEAVRARDFNALVAEGRRKLIEARSLWISEWRQIWQTRVVSQVTRGSYDAYILLANPYCISSWTSLMIGRILNRRVLLWAHGIVRGASIADRLKLLLMSLPDGLLLYDDREKARLVDRGFQERSIFVVYNSLDYDRQRAIREALEWGGIDRKSSLRGLFRDYRLPTLVFVGRLKPRKSLGMLIMLARSMHDEGLPVNVLLIGEGEDRAALEDLTKVHGLEANVAFYGARYEEEELAPLIASSDVCVSPGEVGLTAIHALTYGTPVISHDDPLRQMPEFNCIKDGVTGALYKHGSMDSLVEVTKKWLVEKALLRQETRQECWRVIDGVYNPHYQIRVINEAVRTVVDRKI